MSTQSGALGLAMLDYARDLDIGLSTFVSVGNKADVSGNDLIQYWANDPQHRRHPAVPRELRQPAQVQPDRAARRPAQADRRRQVGPLGGGRARGLVAHRRARVERRHRRRAVPSGRRHPDRHARGAVRRGAAARDTSRCPQGRRVGDPDERRRPGHPRRRRVRGVRARRCRRCRSASVAGAAIVSAGGGRPSATRST